MPVVEARGLTKRYKEVVAVDGVTFAVERGQVFGFLGPNGSGKTTTIAMLLGIARPTAGSFSIFDASTPAELLAARARTGATLETPNFYPYLSGRDNLRIIANVKKVDRTRMEECLDIVGLRARAKHRFKTYSLGMKQRLAIAATMLADPELIVLDEPANGLDPQGMRGIRHVIRAMAEQGKTIFLSSHLLWEVERTCSHVSIIRNGRIMKTGSVSDIVAGDKNVVVKANDLERLLAVMLDFPEASAARISDDAVVARLDSGDMETLSRYLASHDVHPSHLAAESQTLEDVFMEFTGGAQPEPDGVS